MLWHIPCASLHFPLFSTIQKESACSSCFRRSVKVGLLKALGLVLRCAVARHFTLTLLQETKEEVHNTHDALIA